ncbi:paraquat-inducible protein A [Roseateles sp. YR242]|uniref:paraquat-inducible protein A n=1 Tax=Roseateles sp. YR242 TaxID=1855305 RepID=UPI0008BA93E7|nr:paraquat-inducible protein A [Roseateles sp. YR242]SEL23542.1 paraquat-inducible protein A [Roseateles sp. YR242]
MAEPVLQPGASAAAQRRPRAFERGVIGCHSCGQVSARAGLLDAQACPRCGAPLHHRKPNSIARAWALLLAGLIFYIPANLLPVMHTQMLGRGGDSTIMNGVVEFWRAGAWDIALIIFVASVAVPCTKFLAMALLLVTTQRRSTWAQAERSRLYRFVELIGYWSMLDVVVVALVAALVKFRQLSDIEPRIGILYFGMVVILTMLSAMSFDPRLIWDAERPNEPSH